MSSCLECLGLHFPRLECSEASGRRRQEQVPASAGFGWATREEHRGMRPLADLSLPARSRGTASQPSAPPLHQFAQIREPEDQVAIQVGCRCPRKVIGVAQQQPVELIACLAFSRYHSIYCRAAIQRHSYFSQHFSNMRVGNRLVSLALNRAAHPAPQHCVW